MLIVDTSFDTQFGSPNLDLGLWQKTYIQA
jgi:hypothetical protein